MGPNINNTIHPSPTESTHQEKAKEEKRQIAWGSVIFFTYLHIGSIIGLYYFITTISWTTMIYACSMKFISTQGIGAGAHRLWAHRSYKARLPLKIYLAIIQTMTYQKDIYNWCRDHRMHHKFSDQEPDPHNASKGFFYSHMGWLMLKKTQTTKSKLYMLDLSDLEADPLVMFQRKYYLLLSTLFALIIPTVVPWYFWNEGLSASWHVCVLLRIAFTIHLTCLVNSAAHIFGTKPYDKNIKPTENMLVSYLTDGEGFHNYHHAFPYDYKAAELGSYCGNGSTAFIDFMSKLGLAYDLKSVPNHLVVRRMKKTGDGTWRLKEQNTWGWGDKDMDREEENIVKSKCLK